MMGECDWKFLPFAAAVPKGVHVNSAPTVEKLDPSVAYIRQLYGSVLDWYKSADAKAQVILTLDGVFLSFVANTLFGKADVYKLPWYSFALLGLMSITLAISLFHAISCIWSRIYTPEELKHFLAEAGVDCARYQTYTPSVCWFFQLIASLDKAEFEKRMRSLEPEFEVDAMASQIFLLSGNVAKKHRHINYSFSFAAITLLLFLASAMSFVSFLHSD